MDKITAKQIESVLLGVAVGDALGVPAEFQPRGTFKITDMTGFGSHNQPLGTWSDDTSLTLCLAASIADGFSLDDTARRFVRWYRDAYMTAGGVVFDIGGSTAAAIRRIESGVATTRCGCAAANENGNGSLMRIAPLVFLTADKPEAERFALTKAVSSITHAHAWSVAACFIYLEYLRKLLDGTDKNVAYAELRGDFQKIRQYLDGETLGKYARLLRSDISALPEAEIQSGGFVVHTLEAAFWCFLTTENYRDAVLKAVNLGDDTDTTAAVTGSLAGLYYGFGEMGIPQEWINSLAGAGDILKIAERLDKNFK